MTPSIDVKVGQDVLYVLSYGNNVGEVRPAKVVKIWPGNTNGCCQLVVFIDGSHDVSGRAENPILWATSVMFDLDKKPGTWHWL